MKKNVVLLLFFLSSCTFLLAQGYKIGDKASDFKLKNVDGKTV